MSETAEITKPVEQEANSRFVTVTSENLESFIDEQLKANDPVLTPEQQAQEELVKVEAEKAERLAAEEAAKKAESGEEEIDHPEPKKKAKLNERMSELTAKRKEAEAKALQAAEEARIAREEREAIQRERDELKAKYEPPKTEQDPEPLPEQFTDMAEYRKAIKEWTADNVRREDAKKAAIEAKEREQAATLEAWTKRQAEAKADLPDYDAKIAGSNTQVHGVVQDAILESEIGPQILYHLAEHPEIAQGWAKMTPSKMLIAFGKLESALISPPAPKVEVSKAPAPITPLRGANAPAGLKVDAKGQFYGTYEEFKKARESGQIQ